MAQASCHPDRPARSRGLCRACYDRWYAQTVRFPGSKRRRSQPYADCHPDQPHHALGLCKPCYWKTRGPAKRAWGLKAYGLSPDDYDTLVALQDGRCRICGSPAKRLHVDHDHGSGAIRGLLCGRCNRGIGMLGDSPDTLRRAAEYIENGRSA